MKVFIKRLKKNVVIQIVQEIGRRSFAPSKNVKLTDLKADLPEPEIFQYLTASERKTLGQLDKAYDDLSSTLSMVIKFRRQLYDLGLKRRAAGDERGAAMNADGRMYKAVMALDLIMSLIGTLDKNMVSELSSQLTQEFGSQRARALDTQVKEKENKDSVLRYYEKQMEGAR